MLQAGMFIMLQRVRQHAAVIRVDGYDPRGFWRGSQVIEGRVHRSHLRLFRGDEVQAVKAPEGYRCILPGVVA